MTVYVVVRNEAGKGQVMKSLIRHAEACLKCGNLLHIPHFEYQRKNNFPNYLNF